MPNIKFKLFIALTVTLWLSSQAYASHNYVSATAASTAIKSYSNSITAGLSMGKNLHHILPHFSVEGDLLKSFTSAGKGSISRSYSKVGVYSVLTFPINNRLMLKGKMGLRYVALKDVTPGSNTSRENDSGMDFGVGATVKLDRLKSFLFEYITSDSNDFTQFVIGLQFYY